jgi:pimeloyl-ACP methyl ester carboxylesterase
LQEFIMSERTEMPDVIVLIPGILGSVLQKDGKPIWGPNWSTIAGMLPVWGKSLEQMTVIDDDHTQDLNDGITAASLMPDVHLIPGFWKIDGYTAIREEIIRNFDVEPGQNFFEFPYDWRRDNRHSAARLQRDAATWLTAWRERSGNLNARLIIIGHSMGGLVARYYIEALGGWTDTRALITFGTPYRGAAKALGVLANGAEKAFGLIDASSFVRSLTSAYQLLPTYKCFDEGDGKLKHLRTSALPRHVDPLRVKSAWFDFHDKIAKAEKQNRTLPGYPTRSDDSPGFPIRAVVGLRSQTMSTGFMIDGKLELLANTRLLHGEGDSTVPRIAATPEPKFLSSAYTSTKHASMQNVEGVLTDLFGFITSLYVDVGTFLGPGDARPKATFDVGDAYQSHTEIEVEAVLDAPDQDHRLVVHISPTRGGEASTIELASADDQLYRGAIPGLATGFYRITLRSHADIDANRAIEPSTDVFAVADEQAFAGFAS